MNRNSVKRVILSLWVFLLMITLAYAFTFPAFDDNKRSLSYYLNTAFGLFTPMWMYNSAGSLVDRKWVITFPVLLLGLTFGEKLGNELGRWPILRSIYNLTALVALTMAMDLLIWGEWRSLNRLVLLFHRG